MKWKRNKKTNVVSTNEEIIRICEEEGKKKKSHIPLGLIVVLIFALGAAGYFGYCLWCYYQEYQDYQKLYGDLREAVLQATDESEQPELSTEESVSESDTKQNGAVEQEPILSGQNADEKPIAFSEPEKQILDSISGINFRISE